MNIRGWLSDLNRRLCRVARRLKEREGQKATDDNTATIRAFLFGDGDLTNCRGDLAEFLRGLDDTEPLEAPCT